MAGQRRDYILDQIDLLRQAVARLVNDQASASLDEMLQHSFNLQEKLFGMPPADFLQKEVVDQVELLTRNESPAGGREKVLSYAKLLNHTAALYAFRGREDLANGARQLALHVALTLSAITPADEAHAALIGDLAAAVDPATLHPPVLELLQRFAER